MTELTVGQRLDRLEHFAKVECWRCRKVITMSDANIISSPTFDGDKMLLCHECKSDYIDLLITVENQSKDTLKNYLREIRKRGFAK